MPKINLATITASIEAEYGSTFVELPDGSEVELLNPIRLSPEGRKRLLGISSSRTEGPEDEAERELSVDERAERQERQINQLVEMVNIVAVDADQAAALITACSPRGYVDVAILGDVVGEFMEEQKVGEASASQD